MGLTGFLYWQHVLIQIKAEKAILTSVDFLYSKVQFDSMRVCDLEADNTKESNFFPKFVFSSHKQF